MGNVVRVTPNVDWVEVAINSVRGGITFATGSNPDVGPIDVHDAISMNLLIVSTTDSDTFPATFGNITVLMRHGQTELVVATPALAGLVRDVPTGVVAANVGLLVRYAPVQIDATEATGLTLRFAMQYIKQRVNGNAVAAIDNARAYVQVVFN